MSDDELTTPPVAAQAPWAELLAAADAAEKQPDGEPAPDERYGLDDAEWDEATAPSEEEKRTLPPRNRLMTMEDVFGAPPMQWLIPEVIHRSGLGQLYGPAYSGKTLAAVDLALSVCAGLDTWMGHPIEVDGPQDVLYIGAEGGDALYRALRAWQTAHPEADLRGFRLLDGSRGDNAFLQVAKQRTSEQQFVDYEDSIHRLARDVVTAGRNPVIIVWDTQIDVAPGLDENNNVEVVGVLRYLKSISDQLGCFSLLVHHTGHDASRPRGASGMRGKVDVMAGLSPVSKSDNVTITFEKVKGTTVPDPMIFTKESVQLATGESAGLARHLPNAEAQSKRASSGATTGKELNEDKVAVLAAVVAGETAAKNIMEVSRVPRLRCTAALKALAEEGKIINRGTSPRHPQWVALP